MAKIPPRFRTELPLLILSRAAEAFTLNEWLATREAMQQEEPELRLALKQNDRNWTSEELDDEFSCE
jgi:hypothetical protein